MNKESCQTLKQALKSVDWNRYEEDFPSKYWAWGKFDDFLVEQLKVYKKQNRGHWNVLDVGAGVHGTKSLKQELLKMKGEGPTYTWDVLDPGIHTPPPGIDHQVAWNEINEKAAAYDIIVARGSINYLNEKEIHQLLKTLKTGGMMLFNTMNQKPSSQGMERVIVEAQGKRGVERAWSIFEKKQDQKSNHDQNDHEQEKIVHEIHWDHHQPIQHDFFFRPMNFWETQSIKQELTMEWNVRGSSVDVKLTK